ncbi:hypothetical protein SLE2022_258790 [Rubroshorea leprosula]
MGLKNPASNKKIKVIFIMGATATGKTKLSIDLARYFGGEIINSDKIQVYRGLDIVTNKVTEEERHGVPHHLLGFVDPDEDFTVNDFCHHVLKAIDRIIQNGRIPIIAGGSNTYVETLVENTKINFLTHFDCCFLWMDVQLPVLYKRVRQRVDEMVEAGMVDEVGEMFVPEADYERGVRRAIGAPELDKYFRAKEVNAETKKQLLEEGIEEVKVNTLKLVIRQIEKIKRLRDDRQWPLHRLDATPVFENGGKGDLNAWQNMVMNPSREIITAFLNNC